jgi:hypothetical protein
MSWTCPKCGFTIPGEPLAPVRCKCVNTQKPLTYGRALRRWAQAGYPVRTDDEVKAILDTHCRNCQAFFDGSTCQHVNCGCSIKGLEEEKRNLLVKMISSLGFTRITKRTQGLVNKLRMATESCPERKWGTDGSPSGENKKQQNK